VRITGWISSDSVRDEILAARRIGSAKLRGGPARCHHGGDGAQKARAQHLRGRNPELVRTGETGWLFPAGSLDDLVAAMEDCLSRSGEEIQQMGDAGFKRVIEYHSIDIEAAKLARLFRLSTPS